MSLSQTEQNPTPQIELNFWSDWRSTLWIVPKSLAERPRIAIAVLLLVLVEAIAPNLKGLALIEQGLVTFLVYRAIRNAYMELFPEVKSNPDVLPSKVEPTMFGATWVFGLETGLMCLLLVLPGIWFGTTASLAVIAVAVDGAGAFEAIGKSQKLVKGHFWQTFRYVIGGPFLMAVIPFSAIVGTSVAVDAMNLSSAKVVEILSDFLISMGAVLMQLSLAPLLLRLYVKLKIDHGDPLIHQRNPIDSKLMPKWDL